MSTAARKESDCKNCKNGKSYTTHKKNLHILKKWQSIPFSNIDLPIQRICTNCQDYGWCNLANQQTRCAGNAYGRQMYWKKTKRRSQQVNVQPQTFIQRLVKDTPCMKRFAQYYVKSDTLSIKEREKKELNKIFSDPLVLNVDKLYSLQDISHIRNNVEQEWYRRSVALTKKHKLFINFLQQHYCNGSLRSPSSISNFPQEWFNDLHTLYFQVGYEPMKYFRSGDTAPAGDQQKKSDVFVSPNYNWLLCLQRMANCKDFDKLLQLGRLGHAALEGKFSPQKLTELIMSNKIHSYFPLTIEEYNFYRKYFEQNQELDQNCQPNVNYENPIDNYN